MSGCFKYMFLIEIKSSVSVTKVQICWVKTQTKYAGFDFEDNWFPQFLFLHTEIHGASSKLVF